jgi:hypothetical protein
MFGIQHTIIYIFTKMVFSNLEFFRGKNDVKICEKFQVPESMKRTEVIKELLVKSRNHRIIKMKKGRIKT